MLSQQRNLFLIDNPPSVSVAEAITRYKNNPNVVYAEPDYQVRVVDTMPGDPLWSQQWDMVKIQAPTAWNTQTNAGDVVVAVVDTGIAFSHPDLNANLWTERLTADYAYFRLRDEGYTPDDIKRWADTIARDTGACRDVFTYFKHEEEGKGPEFARLLMTHLGLL